MYSIVLMAALSNSAATPGYEPVNPVTRSYSHDKNRGCRGCHGCHGCHGCRGCHGCSGGCHGGYGGCYSYGSGCYGGSYGCYGGSYGCYGGGYYHGKPVKPMPSGEGQKKKIGGGEESDLPGGEARSDRSATILVHLPADATLTIDGAPTRSTSSDRRFVSPPLESGKEFHYTLQAVVVRDGKSVTITKPVPVRAGQETTITLDMSEAAVAQR